MTIDRRLCLVGGGKMGGALLAGWLDGGLAAERVVVVEPDPERAADLTARLGVAVAPEISGHDMIEAPDVVVLAVKPQTMDEAAPAYAALAGPGTVFLSIAAGRTVASLQRPLGVAAAIVRAMPNTPAAIGRGISVAFANPNVTAEQRRICDSLLAAVGTVAWVDDEVLLEPVTGVSGSGPAYLFLFIECLAKAGEAAGLAPDLALQLARTTVWGAAELAYASDEPVETLRHNVTSPNGTTQAALDVLMATDGLQGLLSSAVEAATQRSRELAE